MMMNWLYYLLEANLYLTVAYGCYWLLFRKQTFYNANRLYLLLSAVICFVIPLVQFEYRQLATKILEPQPVAAQIGYIVPTTISTPVPEPAVALNKAIISIYCITALAMSIFFVTKLYSLLKLILQNHKIKEKGYTLIHLEQAITPFSFFGYLFIDNQCNLPETVLRHELVHINQKHSWDIVFTEILKIINWFNPVVYLLQNSLKALHEFEADRRAAQNNQQDEYVTLLIRQACYANGVPFANHFSNQQLLKSRIMKLYQKRSGKLARLNYLLAVPLCAGLICTSTFAFSKSYGWIRIGNRQLETKNILPDSLAQKLRLKVTSNGMTGITDKLEIKGYPGKTMIYTAQKFTAADKNYLLQNFGISVETTTASATTTSVVLPAPPPPPVETSKLKNAKALPFMPVPKPNYKNQSHKKVKFPPPVIKPDASPVYNKAVNPTKAIIKFPPPKIYSDARQAKVDVNQYVATTMDSLIAKLKQKTDSIKIAHNINK